jgi:hypothetical protein
MDWIILADCQIGTQSQETRKMDPNKPVSGELNALLPVLAETMKFATQALAEADALASVSIEKGVLAKAELDAKMRAAQSLREKLMRKFDEEMGKVS